MIILYRIFFLPVLLAVMPWYLWRMHRRGGYAEGFSGRFGRYTGIPEKRAGVKRLWIQAVSVGEVLALGPLLDAINASGRAEVCLTTTTSTGYALARLRLGKQTAWIGYFPIDFWCWSRRAWNRIRPDLAVLMEAEMWPEHLAQARSRGVPVVLINARLSDRTHSRLQRSPWAVAPMFNGLAAILAATRQDEGRLLSLGVKPERIRLTGNLKLDVEIPRIAPAEAETLRRELGFPEGEPVLLGSSTWPGEEKMLLDAWRAIRGGGRPCRLLLVPRHAERRGEITALLEQEGVAFHLRSRGPAPAAADVAVADTTGELRRLTQLAGLVFVGKSLPPNSGGQTPIEAAALGRPVVFGPDMSNFRELAASLEEVGGARRVADAASAVTVLGNLWKDPEALERMSAAGEAWHRAGRGAVSRTAAILLEQLEGSAA